MSGIPGSRLFDDAATQYLSYPVALVTLEPITLACMFRTNDVTTEQALINVGDTGVANGDRIALNFDGTGASDPIRALTRSGGIAVNSAKTGVLVNTWHQGTAVFPAADRRVVYLDGIAGTAETTAKAPTGLDVTYLGARAAGTIAAYLSGEMAYAAIWQAALTGQDIARLAAGWHPAAVQRAGLVACWDLAGVSDPELDAAGGYHLTLVNGPTRSQRVTRPIYREPVRPWRYTGFARGRVIGGGVCA